MKKRLSTKKVAFLGLSASLALLLSWIEFLLPPLYAAVPGIKIGLPNVVILTVLYLVGTKEAAAVSLVRLCVSSLLFGNPVTFVYSAAGAVLSLLLMILLKKLDRPHNQVIKVHRIGSFQAALIFKINIRSHILPFGADVLAIKLRC